MCIRDRLWDSVSKNDSVQDNPVYLRRSYTAGTRWLGSVPIITESRLPTSPSRPASLRSSRTRLAPSTRSFSCAEMLLSSDGPSVFIVSSWYLHNTYSVTLIKIVQE